MEPNRAKYSCKHEGCNKSYLRSEHLNRHTLIHKKAAFHCYLCQKRFTRNDLLNAHLRRHEKRGQIAELAAKTQSNSTSSPPPVLSPTAQNNSAHEQSPAEVKSPPSKDWEFAPPQLSEPQPAPVPPPIPAPAPVTMNQYQEPITLPPQPTQHSDTSLIYPPAQTNDALGHHPVSTATMLPHHLPPQPFTTAQGMVTDYTWLFHSSSLFDLPPDDYLTLHFGGGLAPGSPTGFYPALENQPPQPTVPQYTLADHERLVGDCPNLLSSPLKYAPQVNQILQLALDYCDLYLPLFHRPTFEVSSCPSVLLLALSSLGSFLSGSHELCETGKMLHKYIWSSTVEKALSSPRVELWFLQSLVLIEHICTYTMGRHEHEMAEIVHSMIVTLARRNNLLTESIRPEGGSRQSIDLKWREWARRESIIRIAYTIFVNDVQYSVFFSHHALLCVGMMKLPLPSPSALWEASSASEWEKRLRQVKRSTRSRYYSLDSAVESIMSMKNPDNKREFMQCFNVSNPFSIHLLIHGIAAAISDSKYRSVASSTTIAIEALKMDDFEEALRHWRTCFDKLPDTDRKSRISWCSEVMYHFSAILVRTSLSDIQMAAGSAYSSGRAVTPQCAQAAYTRLVSTEPVSHESYLHGVEVVSLCLQEGEGQSPLGPGSLSYPSESRPLWQTYGAFLGLVVIWARILGLEQDECGDKRLPGLSSALSSNLLPNVASNTMKQMYQCELALVESSKENARILKTQLRQLSNVVCERLTAPPWEISHEASRILTSLGDRDTSRRQSFSPQVGNSTR